jgi:hypothetical protein
MLTIYSQKCNTDLSASVWSTLAQIARDTTKTRAMVSVVRADDLLNELGQQKYCSLVRKTFDQLLRLP